MAPSACGVRSWAPAFDLIAVEDLGPLGKLITVTVASQRVAQFRLPQDAADALAARLCAKGAAA